MNSACVENRPVLFLVDDHPLYRSGTHALIAKEAEFEIYEFGNLNDALAALSQQCPSIVLLDLELPDGSGLSSAGKFLNDDCEPKVVILTTHKEASYIEHARALGLHGYLCKDDDPESILCCLRSMQKWTAFYISPQADEILAKNDDAISASDNDVEELTAREQEVLYLLSCDLTSKEIGKKLGVSFRTVQNHRANIKSKFSFKRNSQLLKFAEQNKSHLEKLYA